MANRCLILFEDEHLLVVNKPTGWNTHAPAPFANEGVYDWLKHREPRWASLAIHQRLDKETSGVLVFGKSRRANQSLAEQFERRQIRKQYILLTDRAVPQREFVVRDALRHGQHRTHRDRAGRPAETRFWVVSPSPIPVPPAVHKPVCLRAEPRTGRTHQIRAHAAARGFPVLGDTEYGGSPCHRLCLHAEALTLHHPLDGRLMTFAAPADFITPAAVALRRALVEPDQTNLVRLVHGASDGWPGWYVDQYGDYLLSQSTGALTGAQRDWLAECLKNPPTGTSLRGAYHKILTPPGRSSVPVEAVPHWVQGALPTPELAAPQGRGASPSHPAESRLLPHGGRGRGVGADPGEPAPAWFCGRENGLAFELSFAAGGNPGLFLDQRDNRRRWLVRHIAADFPWPPALGTGFTLLNLFAYTGGFSVAAARAGAQTTSVDLSARYLEHARRNFQLNGLDPAHHEFLRGDVFEWLRRLHKMARRFEAVVLDPPTFSQSKTSGVFRAENDFGRLLAAALRVLRPGGLLFCASNAASWPAEKFVMQIRAAITQSGRQILRAHYVPQPPDFPVSRNEPAYLKTLWVQVD